MKLVEILARELNEWPIRAEEIGQWPGGEVCVRDLIGVSAREIFTSITIADDVDEWVTRAQWEAERARIAETDHVVSIIGDSDTASMEDDLKNHRGEIFECEQITGGKRSKEDQALWDDIAKAHFKKVCTEEYNRFQFFAEIAFDAADEFMAERSKRMK